MFHLLELEGKDEWKYGCEDVVMDELDWLLKKQTSCRVSLSGSLCAENRSRHISYAVFYIMMIASFLGIQKVNKQS